MNIITEKRTVKHQGRPSTIENVCVECQSYMSHTDIAIEQYVCEECGYKSERIYHIGIAKDGHIIRRLTKSAGEDIRKHFSNKDCPKVARFGKK